LSLGEVADGWARETLDGMALGSVRVPRPAGSSFTSLRQAPCRPASEAL